MARGIRICVSFACPKAFVGGGTLIRVKPRDLAALGVERVPRTAHMRDGLPLLDEGHALDVANVIWCTGYHPSFSWIELPIFAEKEPVIEPVHERGIVTSVPGLYFVGLTFLYSVSSTMVQGVSRDAKRIARAIARWPGGVVARR